MFLTLAQDNNVWYDRIANAREVMYFVQQPGHSLWIEEFKKNLLDYRRFRHPQVKHFWTKDYRAFTLKLLAGIMPLPGLTLSTAARYRDGQPFTRLLAATQLP